LRTLFGVASGQISMSQGYGKSSFVAGGTKGYFCGGFSTVTQITGIQFSNEAQLDPAAALAQGRGGGGGVNSITRGYIGGGTSGPAGVTQIDGIQFSDESAIDPAAALVQPRDDLASVNSSTRGYFNGGGGGEPVLSQIDGIQFDNEAAIDPAAAISLTNHSGVNSPTRGYFGGGSRTPSASQTIIQRLEFSTETAAATTAGIVQTRGGSAGVQDSNN
jgi:hypothetical protein